MEARRGTGGNQILLTPFEIFLMRPMMNETERGKGFQMRSLVSWGQVAKKPLSVVLQKVDLAGKPAVTCSN